MNLVRIGANLFDERIAIARCAQHLENIV